METPTTFTEKLAPLIPRGILFGNPEKAGPAISPNGRMLAYLAPDKGVMNVWVRTIDQQDDRVVTADTKRGIRTFFWQQDGTHIIYLQDQGGDENFHVYQTNLETKSTRDLTPFEGALAQIVKTDANFPDQMLVAINVQDKRLFDVYRIDLQSGTAELDTENPGDVAGWGTDNNFQVRIAQVTLPDGGTESRIRDNAESPWRTFQKWSPDEVGGVAGFTPDNNGVWVISSVDANAARLLQVELASGKAKVLAEDEQFDVGSILSHPRRHTLEAVQFIRARSEWMLVDESLQSDFDVIRQVRDGDFSIISRDLDDKTWIISCVTDDGPIYYYAYDRTTKQPTLLFSSQPALEKYKLAKVQPVSFQARDEMTIYGYLTLPVGTSSKNLPTVLYVHGGPWARDTWGLNSAVQWLANRGYAVLQINYRGSTGYGKAYLNAGDREWAGKMHTDLLDGKAWAIEKGYADPEKVGIMGGSYGGYATLVGLAFTPDEFACGVDIVGPSSIVTLIKSIPPYWIPIKSIFEKRVGNVEFEEEFLHARSPLRKVDQIKKPLLIGQGANDPRVKQTESEQIVEAMRKAGKPVEYIVYTDEGHGFARPENRLHFYAKTEEFLAKYLGGRLEPLSEVKNHSGIIK